MKRSEILTLLPEIFQRTAHEGNLLTMLLDVMEQMHAPDEAVLATLDRYFDPYRAPDAFVPFLATWVELGELLREVPEGVVPEVREPFPGGIGRLRSLIATAAYLSQWRGTRQALLRFLETATGATGFLIDEELRPYHLVITAPATTKQYALLLQKIIELEKPAYVTYELVFTAD